MIRNIIFDLGNVLVRVDYEKFVEGVLSEGVSEDELNRIFVNGLFKDSFESGEVSPADFLYQVTRRLNNKVTAEKFIFHFNSMFSEVPAMKDILLKLSAMRRFGLYILSNTNPIHFEYFRTNFEHLWVGYEAFKRKVEEVTPSEFSLRDKDRYLWGRSFYQQLVRDIEGDFTIEDDEDE